MSIFAGMGEVLWDVVGSERTLGGAPANFAFHVNGLGGCGSVMSCIGDDDLGHEALGLLAAAGVDTSHVRVDPGRPTGTVLAELDAAGRATYTFPPDVAWDALAAEPQTLERASRLDGICFGTLGQRSIMSRRAIREVVAATGPDALRIFDVNLRQDFYSRDIIRKSMELASVLKLSDEELPELAAMFDLAGTEEEQLARLLERFGLRLAALTMGGKGSLLMTRDTAHREPGRAIELADTIGAGDSFTAALALGLQAGWELEAVHARAADVAAFVCGHAGGMVSLPDTLKIL